MLTSTSRVTAKIRFEETAPETNCVFDQLFSGLIAWDAVTAEADEKIRLPAWPDTERAVPEAHNTFCLDILLFHSVGLIEMFRSVRQFVKPL